MPNRNHPQRWEAAILATALAIAGTLFLFDNLGAVVLTHLHSWPSLLHSSPAALAGVAAALLWAEEENPPVATSNRTQNRAQAGQL